MKILHIFISITLFTGLLCSSCNTEDQNIDLGKPLSFSTDTVDFSMAFTEIGSPTYILKIFNQSSSSQTIQSIELMNPSSSGFRINLDGEIGTRFDNVEILKKDSLYALLGVTVKPQDSDAPVLVYDSIRFVTNGTTQYVYLKALGQDVYVWNKKTLNNDTVITGNKPILVYDTLKIAAGVKVTMQENTRLYFYNKGVLSVRGTIEAKGTIEKPVVMTNHRFDDYARNVSYQNVPGGWEGVVIHAESFQNVFENVLIRNMVSGINCEESDETKLKAKFTNTIVNNSFGNILKAVNCKIEAANCVFANAQKTVVDLAGGDYLFTHCTIANYFAWNNFIYESLAIGNIQDMNTLPLNQCSFINCIIYGRPTNNLKISIQGNTFNYQFINCLIKNQPLSNPLFVNNHWNEDPQFVSTGDGIDPNIDFNITVGSGAINHANKTYSGSLPLDINGNSRLSDSEPDIGCYEWNPN